MVGRRISEGEDNVLQSSSWRGARKRLRRGRNEAVHRPEEQPLGGGGQVADVHGDLRETLLYRGPPRLVSWLRGVPAPLPDAPRQWKCACLLHLCPRRPRPPRDAGHLQAAALRASRIPLPPDAPPLVGTGAAFLAGKRRGRIRGGSKPHIPGTTP